MVVVVLFVVLYCHFLLLDQKKVTKEKIKADPIAPRVLPGLRAEIVDVKRVTVAIFQFVLKSIQTMC